MRLSPRRANAALKKVADPLGISVQDAAIAVRKVVDNNMAQAIFKEVALKGYDPRHFTLLAYGGNGPTHLCGYAEGLDVRQAIAPMNSSVFSAVGAGNLDQVHIYDRNTYVYLYNANTGKLYENYGELNGLIEELRTKGTNDIIRMGYGEAQVRCRVEFDLRYGDQLALTTLVSPHQRFQSPRQILDVIKLFHKSYGERFGEGSQTPEVGVNLNNVRVVSYVPLEKVSFASNGNGRTVAPRASSLEHALKGKRSCYFEALGGFSDTPCYDYAKLGVGVPVRGHAIVEAPHTTFVVYPGWTLEMKQNGFIWLDRKTA
jgi:N-methylhydantoinase A